MTLVAYQNESLFQNRLSSKKNHTDTIFTKRHRFVVYFGAVFPFFHSNRQITNSRVILGKL